MDKLKIRGMKSNASNEGLRRFRGVVFSVADHRVAHRRKLRSDLVLQSRHQLNPDEGSIRKKAFDGISKLGAGGFGVSRGAHLLKHSFPSKIVHQCPCLSVETAAHYREIAPYGSMGEKLPHQRMSIRAGFRKHQGPRGKTIDTMHDHGALFLALESRDQQRQSGRSVRTLNGHGQESGRLVENDHGIVFVKHRKLPGETRPAPVFSGCPPLARNVVRLTGAAAGLSRTFLQRTFLHWLSACRSGHYRAIPLTSQTRGSRPGGP